MSQYQRRPRSVMYYPEQFLENQVQARTFLTTACKPTPTKSPDQIQNSVSCLAWNYNCTENIPFLAATDWSGRLKLYRLIVDNDYSISMELKRQLSYEDVSLLKCCWDPKKDLWCYFGDSAGSVRSCDLDKGIEQKQAEHDKAISSLQYLESFNLLASTGYQSECRFWDGRQRKCALRVDLPGKVLCSAHNQNFIAYGLSNYKLAIMDVRKGPKYFPCNSPLGENSQIQSIALHPLTDLIAVGSFDGRTVVTPLISNSQDQVVLGGQEYKIYKAHFKEIEGLNSETVSIQYPVNCVGFSPSNSSWFYSAGSTKSLVFLDYVKEKKVRSYERGGPITAVGLTVDGGCMAYSAGNDWHTGQNEDWGTQIAIKLMKDTDYFLK